MPNYRIKTNSTDESLKIQELFQQLGYRVNWDKNKFGFQPNFFFAKDEVKELYQSVFDPHAYAEITIAQLQDLVVLHRNDVNDATYVDLENTPHVEINGQWYFWSDEKDDEIIDYGWNESPSTREYDDSVLKPINKNPPITLSVEIPAPFKGERELNKPYWCFTEMQGIYWDSEEKFNQVVSALRKTLGDDPQ